MELRTNSPNEASPASPSRGPTAGDQQAPLLALADRSLCAYSTVDPDGPGEVRALDPDRGRRNVVFAIVANALESGSLQVGTPKVNIPHVRIRQIGFPQVRILQGGAVEICPVEIGTLQVGVLKIRPLQVGPVQVSTLQIYPA